MEKTTNQDNTQADTKELLEPKAGMFPPAHYILIVMSTFQRLSFSVVESLVSGDPVDSALNPRIF